MNKKAIIHDVMWIASEILYYLGLLLVVLIPFITISVWMLNLADRFDFSYGCLLIAWLLSVGMFFSGVLLKKFIYANVDD